MTQAIAPVQPFRLPPISSVLLSAKFLTLMIGLVIGVLLTTIASIGSATRIEAPPVDPALQQLAEARANLDRTIFEISEQRRRDDFNRQFAANPGDFQAVIQTMGASIKTRVDAQIADPKHPNFGKPESEVDYSLRQEAMKLMVVAANNQGGTLSYIDPATGKRFDLILSPAEIAGFAMQKLEGISYAEHAQVQQVVKLDELRRDVASQEERLKQAQAAVLDASGQGEVANNLRSQDIYGRRIDTESLDQLSPVSPVSPGPHY